jgi:putative membrane protein
MPYGYQDHMHNGWGAGGIAMIVMMVVFVIAVVAVIWFIVNGQRRPESTDSAAVRATPEQILGERLARGEIDADEYRTRLAALKDHAA